MENEEILQKCSICYKEKPLECFHKSKVFKTGHETRCKACKALTLRLSKDNLTKEEFEEASSSFLNHYYRNWDRYRQRANELNAIVDENGFNRQQRNNILKYGITPEEYLEMLNTQDGKCSICGNKEAGVLNNTLKRLAIDHDHETGQIRDLLCSKCNTALGLLNEDLDLIYKFINYINKHKQRCKDVPESIKYTKFQDHYDKKKKNKEKNKTT